MTHAFCFGAHSNVSRRMPVVAPESLRSGYYAESSLISYLPTIDMSVSQERSNEISPIPKEEATSPEHHESTMNQETTVKDGLPENPTPPPDQTPQIPQPASRGWRFWAIFPPLAIASFLVGLDATIASSALPVITAELGIGDSYIWILNGYLLTSTAFLPLYGQIAQVLGRRWPTMVAVAIFLLGSGLCGGASSSGMLIAGRLIQGSGGAGITGMTQLIISDLVSVRERGTYIGIIYAAFGLGTAIGPAIGGAIAGEGGQWRWIYYLNLPIAGLTLVMQFFFLQIVFVRKVAVRQKLRQIDWVGNFLLIASVVAILIALSWANTRYPWSSFRIIVPLVLGLVGIAVFHLYEASKFGIQPTIPPSMFGNRTSAAGLALTFVQSMLLTWQIFFLPIYFQAVQLASPTRSGVLLLPFILIGVPTSIIAGGALVRTGRYKPIHIIGFTLSTLAAGLYIDLNASSSLAKIVLYQVVSGLGCGILLTTLLPGVQASQPEAAVGPATATWNFYRAFGNTWGASIPAAIFNNQFNARIGSITNSAVRDFLAGGNAYSHVSADYISAIEPPQLRSDVVDAYQSSLRVLWIVFLAFNAFGLLLVFVEREIPLRTTLNSEVKIKDAKTEEDNEKEAAGTESTNNHNRS